MATYVDHVTPVDYRADTDTIDVLFAGVEDVQQLLLQVLHARNADDRIAAADLLSESVLPALTGACGAAAVYERASRE